MIVNKTVVQQRKTASDQLTGRIFNPYNLISLMFVGFGIWMASFDSKGLPLLLLCLFLAAMVRLSFTIRREVVRLRQEIGEMNGNLKEQNQQRSTFTPVRISERKGHAGFKHH
ncbi:hypothetical protein [Deinococcus cellulosilyticus]|uniref:Uncharacterized protein n=1 Tax=Deinococcus cellulosilyticus (strain DSM 18568 / NBRC 106333 / KACC 11606 / 5516J-15) TaxID=1223518 RepID=A0A511NAH9_DEIC1|nr:hypothetical protein [Deinococcus cellulosilyticus]GEM49829.1 hypothetical protein DC3_54640 [Deinococcus cellulosilyticus NBRC 106333 = KACC 11606]